MSHKYLKVKIKSLSAEAQIIRKEENKAKSTYRYLKNMQGREEDHDEFVGLYNGLRNHRLGFRPDLRSSFLAYGFLRGKAYRQVENATDIGFPYLHSQTGEPIYFVWNPDLLLSLPKAAKLATKYGPEPVTVEDFKAWILAGENVVTEQCANAEFALA